jgi:hypothetical protein
MSETMLTRRRKTAQLTERWEKPRLAYVAGSAEQLRPLAVLRRSRTDEGFGRHEATILRVHYACRPVRTRSAALLLVLATALPRLVALLHERGAILASFTDKGDNFAQTFLSTGTYGFIPS